MFETVPHKVWQLQIRCMLQEQESEKFFRQKATITLKTKDKFNQCDDNRKKENQMLWKEFRSDINSPTTDTIEMQCIRRKQKQWNLYPFLLSTCARNPKDDGVNCQPFLPCSSLAHQLDDSKIDLKLCSSIFSDWLGPTIIQPSNLWDMGNEEIVGVLLRYLNKLKFLRVSSSFRQYKT